MGKLTIMLKIGFVWAIISFLSGCALIENLKYSTIESQNNEIDQLTANLIESKQENLALKTENSALKTAKVRLMYINSNLKKNKRELSYNNRKLRDYRLELMETNRKLEEYNQELVMKIDMLKVLDHRVEEKRKNYSAN
jgi:hypothetical protein